MKKSTSERAKKWQAKQIAAGNCECCGKTRKTYSRLCDYHQIKKKRPQAQRGVEPVTRQSEGRMYEVHPDPNGQWILYKTGGGDFLVVGWFVNREDAEFARTAFERREEVLAP